MKGKQVHRRLMPMTMILFGLNFFMFYLSIRYEKEIKKVLPEAVVSALRFLGLEDKVETVEHRWFFFLGS